MTRKSRPTGMLAFTVVWIGQLVSILGTVMTGFALSIWAWQTTGEATALALVSFFTFAPTVLVSPLAGALVDRWNRKLVMMLSDLAAVLSTVVVLLLYLAGGLQIWHLYATGAFAGAFYAFQRPAYSAAITTMMPKKHYGRASGMLSVARFAPNIFAPVLAALLLNLIGNSRHPDDRRGHVSGGRRHLAFRSCAAASHHGRGTQEQGESLEGVDLRVWIHP